MGLTYSNKVLSTQRIDCGGSFQITLSLTAEPNIVSHPTDIVLILDRSGSMAGAALANLKAGARKFIDIIAESTGGQQSGQIGYGSRIGVVSFADTATQDTQLITSVSDLKAAVDGLRAGGSTNHADAFTKALELLTNPAGHAKVMVMFTDGETTAGGDPNALATLAKAQGVTIYCIGLSGQGGIDEQALRDWASDPDSSYVVITPDDEELEDLFEDLAQNIAKPGATNIVVTDRVSPCFRITTLHSPTKGTATLVGTNEVRWEIDKLGITASEGASLSFLVEHIGPCSGLVEVNESTTYHDSEGNTANFPSPQITVDCGEIVHPESCPEPVDVVIGSCEDVVEFDAGAVSLESLGRILKLDVTVPNVCPHRRVALAVILTELDEYDEEHDRGIKVVTIPAHTQSGCRDVTVRCVKFVLPEDLNVSGETDTLCSPRRFRARMIAHYVDSGFVCCDDVTGG